MKKLRKTETHPPVSSPPPMPSPRLLLFALLFALAFLVPAAAVSGEQLFRHDYRDHPDTFVQIESLLGGAARQGSLPFRITVRNQSGRTRLWTVRLVEPSNGYGSKLTSQATFRFEVPDGQKLVRDVAFPFVPAFLTYEHRNLEIHIGATGLPDEVRHHREQTPADFPTLALSRALGSRSISELDHYTVKQNSSNPRFATLFDPEDLPSDWVAYTGLDAILLDRDGWNELGGGQRQALLAWVRLGGTLDLFADNEDLLKLKGVNLAPPAPGSDKILSLGRIREWTWNGRELPVDIVHRYQKDIPQRAEALATEFGHRWDLYATVRSRNFNPAIVFFILVVFAVLVAPVNLFYLAKAGRRHRLFITTPLISVGTCLAIVLVIFFIDGVGGEGRRVVLADLQPGDGENRLYTTQEQVSRTGVMMSSGFSARRHDLSPVSIPDSPYNPFSRRGNRTSTFSLTEGHYHGDFFRSRSEQAYLLRSVEPSRARIEYLGEENGLPLLVSNLPQEILDLRYRDAKGAVWILQEGASAAPGERLPLRPAPGKIPLDQSPWSLAASLLSESNEKRVAQLWNEKHRFFAIVRDPEAFALPTHPRLRWKETDLILTGTPSGEATPAETSSDSPATPAGNPPAS